MTFVYWLMEALVLLIAAYLLPGVHVASFLTALIVAVALAIVNLVLRPILVGLTLPINFLTLGLFTLVINALLLMLVAYLVPGFKIDSFWWALLLGLILSLLNGLFLGVKWA